MISADHWHDNGDGTAWVVLSPPLWVHDLPCDTCGGYMLRPVPHREPQPCPDCSGTGRHTFTVEIGKDVSVPMGNPQTDGWRIRTFRCSVVPGMVLPIEWWHDGKQIPTYPVIWMYSSGSTHVWMKNNWKRITLPSAAAPGMWAVRLQLVG